MNEKRYFTAQEVDLLIPQLEHIFDHIQSCRSRAEELAAQSLQCLKATEPVEVAQAQMLRSQAEFLIEAVQENIHHIETLGGTTKDVEIGLVDFLGDVEGQDVWLCWRKGESRIRFWHPLDGGYNQRRPLPRANSTLH